MQSTEYRVKPTTAIRIARIRIAGLRQVRQAIFTEAMRQLAEQRRAADAFYPTGTSW